MNEFDLIERYFLSGLSDRPHSSRIADLGNGDDCAVLKSIDGRLAVSTDAVVLGRHVPIGAPAAWLASRGLGSSVSDLVAMGAKPLGFTLALTLPKVSPGWMKAFSQSLFRTAGGFDIELLGGDVTRGPLTASFTVFGELPRSGRLLRRSAAKAGDRVWVSGTLGAAAGALPLLTQKLSAHDRQYSARLQLLQAYVFPAPPIALGLRLQADVDVNAAIDISDGLLADLMHIAKASQVDVELDSAAIPVAVALQALYSNEQALIYALTGGDDYQIGFTASADWTLDDADVKPIGKIVAGDGRLLIDGKPVETWLAGLSSSVHGGSSFITGYQHFNQAAR